MVPNAKRIECIRNPKDKVAKPTEATRTDEPKPRGRRDQKPHDSGKGKRKNGRVFEAGRDRNCRYCEGPHWDPDCPSKTKADAKPKGAANVAATNFSKQADALVAGRPRRFFALGRPRHLRR